MTAPSTSNLYSAIMVGNIVENGMSVDPDTITEQMEREAINSLHRSSEDRKASSHHILGDGDESHKLSMLQKITAKRILDYKMIFVRHGFVLSFGNFPHTFPLDWHVVKMSFICAREICFL